MARIWRSWRLITTLMLCGLLVPVVPAPVSASGAVTAARTVHGIRLSLTLGRSSFPRNALVDAAITIRNTTDKQACTLVGGRTDPNGTSPVVDVFDDHDHLMQSQILDLFMPSQGPPPALVRLPPHRQITLRRFVVLRGPAVQISVPVVPNTTRRCTGARRRDAAPLLHVTLTPPDTPTVRIAARGGHLAASVHYADIVPHSLRYIDAAKCRTDLRPLWENVEWIRVKGLEVEPGCTNPIAWRAVVGTLNHSVAWIRYGPGA